MRAERLGEVARERIEGHTFGRQVERLTQIYRQARETPREASVPPLAACVGHRVGDPTAQAAELLGREDGWHFVMRDWLTPQWAARSRLTWVADPRTPWDNGATELAGTAPVIVDVRNREARRAGLASGALFFHDSAQALRAVRELDDDEAVRAELSHRGPADETGS
jgi:hypothetical protein